MNFKLQYFKIWIWIFLITAEGQFFSGPRSRSRNMSYFKMFMLCKQTPSKYRSIGCRTNRHCRNPQLTRCLSGICCARDDTALAELISLSTTRKTTPTNTPTTSTKAFRNTQVTNKLPSRSTQVTNKIAESLPTQKHGIEPSSATRNTDLTRSAVTTNRIEINTVKSTMPTQATTTQPPQTPSFATKPATTPQQFINPYPDTSKVQQDISTKSNSAKSKSRTINMGNGTPNSFDKHPSPESDPSFNRHSKRKQNTSNRDIKEQQLFEKSTSLTKGQSFQKAPSLQKTKSVRVFSLGRPNKSTRYQLSGPQNGGKVYQFRHTHISNTNFQPHAHDQHQISQRTQHSAQSDVHDKHNTVKTIGTSNKTKMRNNQPHDIKEMRSHNQAHQPVEPHVPLSSADYGSPFNMKANDPQNHNTHSKDTVISEKPTTNPASVSHPTGQVFVHNDPIYNGEKDIQVFDGLTKNEVLPKRDSLMSQQALSSHSLGAVDDSSATFIPIVHKSHPLSHVHIVKVRKSQLHGNHQILEMMPTTIDHHGEHIHHQDVMHVGSTAHAHVAKPTTSTFKEDHVAYHNMGMPGLQQPHGKHSEQQKKQNIVISGPQRLHGTQPIQQKLNPSNYQKSKKHQGMVMSEMHLKGEVTRENIGRVNNPPARHVKKQTLGMHHPPPNYAKANKNPWLGVHSQQSTEGKTSLHKEQINHKEMHGSYLSKPNNPTQHEIRHIPSYPSARRDHRQTVTRSKLQSSAAHIGTSLGEQSLHSKRQKFTSSLGNYNKDSSVFPVNMNKQKITGRSHTSSQLYPQNHKQVTDGSHFSPHQSSKDYKELQPSQARVDHVSVTSHSPQPETPREVEHKINIGIPRQEINFQQDASQRTQAENVKVHHGLGSTIPPTPQVPIYEGNCDDVAIIGAGLSGTYTSWRLRNSHLNISVYEYSNRIGGRILTHRFKDAQDIPVELGELRFLPEKHKRMARAAKELRLTVDDFVNNLREKEHTLYYLREIHLSYEDLGGFNTPYNFRQPFEMKKPEDLRWYISSVYTNFSGNFNNIENDLFTIATTDGIPLYKQSYAEAWAKMGSMEAMRFLRDQAGFERSFGTASALYEIPAGPPSGPNTPEPVFKTIATGMETLPTTLLNTFLAASKKHKYIQNHKLEEIKRENDAYVLSFRKTETTEGKTIELNEPIIKKCAKKVILSFQKSPLQQIKWSPLKSKNMKKNIDSVKDAPRANIYFLYDYPWWRNTAYNALHTTTDLPVRNTYDMGVSRLTHKAVLMVSYVDGKDVQYWRELRDRGSMIGSRKNLNLAVSEHVVRHAHIHLSYIYNISVNKIPPARDGVMMLWDEYPHNGAWGVWKPGFNWNDVRTAITKPDPKEEVYISPGYYGTYSNNFWAEGSLEGADEVLKHFGIPSFV